MGDVGETITINLKSKYWDGEEEGKMCYTPDSDRMSASYDHFLFDKEELQKQFGKTSGISGSVSVKILTKTKSAPAAVDPNLPQPEGGFSNPYFAVQIVGGGGESSSSSESDDEMPPEEEEEANVCV